MIRKGGFGYLPQDPRIAGVLDGRTAVTHVLSGRSIDEQLERIEKLRLDIGPKFVQLIKLVQHEVGRGSAAVRPPRMQVEGDELEQVLALIRERLAMVPEA